MRLLYLKEAYTWLHNELMKMQMLSDKEIKAERELMNPLAKKMGKIINHVVQEKLKGFLTDEVELEKLRKEMFEGDEYEPPARSVHTAIPPADIRIKDLQTKKFPQFDSIVQEIRKKERERTLQKHEAAKKKEHETGLLLAKTGNEYDVPIVVRSHQRPHSVCLNKQFERKEGAIQTQPFDTYYTTNLT